VDTRTKIVTPAEAVTVLRRRTFKVVTGYFDPLLPVHARRLAEIAGSNGRLVVILLNPKRPILAGRARAELVAALDCVEYVVVAGETAHELLSGVRPDMVVREQEADMRRIREFTKHVHGRQTVSLG
jgi:bifunctional ADP-heptose synthase (sugar kinase/adenylyltransferase)